MHEEQSGVPACGHRNPPGAHFCDTCGIRLPMQCPRCHAINRRDANFCSSCGARLGDARRTDAAPLSAPPAPSPDSLSATESDSAPARPEPMLPAKQIANDRLDALGSFDPLPLPAESTKGLFADAPDDEARLERMVRSNRRLQQRRNPQRAWLLGAVGVSVVIAVIAVGLFRTHNETPSANAPRVVGTDPPGPVATRVQDGEPATIAQGAPASTGPPDTTVQRYQRENSPAPTAPAKVPAVAPGQPRAGGELKFVVPSEPPSYDAHREETFALIHPAAPHYNTLLRIDPLDPTGTRVVADLATSWTVSSDKRTYVLKLREGVKFHDGSEMTSRDVRATYEKIINPPPGITSARKGEYLQIETVQAPEPYVVAFKLKWPSPSFIHSLASPWNWIYKADILERDVRWYEKNVMGTGPFVFVEHVKGIRWIGRRNPDYWDRGKPYLYGYQALFIADDAAQVTAIRSGHAHIQFRGFSPAQRDDLVRALPDKITVQESPWNCGLVVAINHDKEPFNDASVRRALSLALDRYQAASALSQTAIVREVAGVQVPGSLFATPPAELVKLAGYSRDIRESRSEARRLLAKAGVPDGFAFVLKNRDVPMPYEHIGRWLADEWRQIGLKVRHEIQSSGQYFKDLRTGNFELSTDFQCGYVVDPDLDLYKFQSRGRSDANYGGYTDPVLDDLYVRQSRTVDPAQRRRYIRAFERRLLDEQAHYISTLQWHRIVPHRSSVRGWTITPSHYLNNQLDTVWLAE
jgi:peptide/nickel transport system substrate-binding protein